MSIKWSTKSIRFRESVYREVPAYPYGKEIIELEVLDMFLLDALPLATLLS